MTEPPTLPSPEQTADKIVTRAGIKDPPVQLARVISIWKHLTVVEDDLDGAGYLLPLGKLGAEIIVNKNDTEVRRRFTIAHELGHWVLGLICEKKLGEFSQPPGVKRAVLERWCDAFAANLLMPSHLVRAWLPTRNQPMLIDAILGAPARFGVSDEAFFIRTWELLKIQIVTLRFDGRKRSFGSFTIEKAYGHQKYNTDFRKLLDVPDFGDQLRMGMPMSYFTLSSKSGAISISGKWIGKNTVIVSVSWPCA